jgi:hypothetical protein
LLHSCHKLLNEIIIFLWAQHGSQEIAQVHMSWILGTRNLQIRFFVLENAKLLPN